VAKLKQILTGEKAKLEVNLDELFGTLVPNSTELRQAVGQAIIDRIRERTADNLDRNGDRFKNYSDEYADSIEFKAYGKSKSDPNLEQTGDMLGLMDIIEEKKNKIVIGWSDKKQAGKAHGHVTGNVGTTRDFLGLPEKDLEEIREEFMPAVRAEVADIDASTTRSSVATTQAFQTGEISVSNRQTLDSIFQALFGDDNG
jgi:hypothetical protein